MVTQLVGDHWWMMLVSKVWSLSKLNNLCWMKLVNVRMVKYYIPKNTNSISKFIISSFKYCSFSNSLALAFSYVIFTIRFRKAFYLSQEGNSVRGLTTDRVNSLTNIKKKKTKKKLVVVDLGIELPSLFYYMYI